MREGEERQEERVGSRHGDGSSYQYELPATRRAAYLDHYNTGEIYRIKKVVGGRFFLIFYMCCRLCQSICFLFFGLRDYISSLWWLLVDLTENLMVS